MMNNFGFAQQQIAENNITIMQQLLDDTFYVKPRPEDAPQQIDKYKILGDFDYIIEHSLRLNDTMQFTKTANLLTQMLNWKAAGIAEMNNVNWSRLVRDIVKTGIGSNSDVSQYYDEKNGAAAMQQQPMNPAAIGSPMGGAGPQPPAPPPAMAGGPQ
jgi:hypothetical protein